MTLAFIGNGDMQVYGLTIKSKIMGKEKVTVNDLKVTLSEIGVTFRLEAGKDYPTPAGQWLLDCNGNRCIGSAYQG
jgi:hypothetical protein